MLGLEREQHSFEFNIINQNKIDMYLSAFGAYDSLSKLSKRGFHIILLQTNDAM